MACLSGRSSGSSLLQNNSVSEGDLQVVMDLRKKKRMISNRESARRSRMRKQKYLDDLMAHITQLRKENNQILSDLNFTTQRFLSVEDENSILRRQVVELTSRLEILNENIRYMKMNRTFGLDSEEASYSTDCFMKQWNMTSPSRPIIP